MPDIDMCKGTDCEARGRCYRHVAKPNGAYQWWMMDVPGKDESCEFYWPMFRVVDATKKEKPNA